LLKIGLRSFSPFPMRKTWGLFCTYLHKCYCISTLKCPKKCGYNTFCSFVDIQITDHKNFGFPIVDITKLCILKWPKLCVLATTYPYEEQLTPGALKKGKTDNFVDILTNGMLFRCRHWSDVTKWDSSINPFIHTFIQYIYTYIHSLHSKWMRHMYTTRFKWFMFTKRG
jgi:hypothetical protein